LLELHMRVPVWVCMQPHAADWSLTPVYNAMAAPAQDACLTATPALPEGCMCRYAVCACKAKPISMQGETNQHASP